MPNAQERGYAFENYVADLLRRDHFAVVNRPGPANRPQVDLFATRGSDHYLLEVKWHKGKVGMPEVDELLRRLQRGAPNIVGVLVSANGFSRSAIERVEQDATRPTVLVTGDELAQVERTGMLHRLLISKHEQLIVHRRASIAKGPLVSADPDGSASTSMGSYAFVGSNGQRLSILELEGGFGPGLVPHLHRGCQDLCLLPAITHRGNSGGPVISADRRLAGIVSHELLGSAASDLRSRTGSR
jgi:hypothetical protein